MNESLLSRPSEDEHSEDVAAGVYDIAHGWVSWPLDIAGPIAWEEVTNDEYYTVD